MRRYLVRFQETAVYEAQIETDAVLDPDDDDSWFQAVDQYDPDWICKGLVEVSNRQLLQLKKLRAKKDQSAR
jgi:hypothetical protein